MFCSSRSSGEASLVVEEWYNSRFPSPPGSSAITTTTNPPIIYTNPSAPSRPTPEATNHVPSSNRPPHPLASLQAGPSKFPVVSRPAFVPPGRKGKLVDNGRSGEEASSRPVMVSNEMGSEKMVVVDQGVRQGKGRRRPRLILMATDPVRVFVLYLTQKRKDID